MKTILQKIEEMRPEELKTLGGLLDLMDKGEVSNMDHIFQLEKELLAKISEVSGIIKDLRMEIGHVSLKEGPRGKQGNVGPKGDSIIGPEGPRGPQGNEGRVGVGIVGPQGPEGPEGRQGISGKNGSPDTGKEIVDKVNGLSIDEEHQIDQSHIKGLLDDLKKIREARVSMGGGANAGGRIVKIYDLSPFLNGVKKTFSLPSMWRIISVHASSTPFSAFIQGTDFTVSGNSITFTSQIRADSTLSTGQSVLIEYAI